MQGCLAQSAESSFFFLRQNCMLNSGQCFFSCVWISHDSSCIQSSLPSDNKASKQLDCMGDQTTARPRLVSILPS